MGRTSVSRFSLAFTVLRILLQAIVSGLFTTWCPPGNYQRGHALENSDPLSPASPQGTWIVGLFEPKTYRGRDSAHNLTLKWGGPNVNKKTPHNSSEP